MITNPLEALLDELGKALDIPNLAPDDNETCLLRIQGNIHIQIELDKDERYLLVVTDFGEIPLGRYRQDLMETALKMNNLPPPLHGVFAYSNKAGHFCMFEKLWFEGLNGELLAETIEKFREKATIWKEAIEHNEIPVISEITTSDHVGIFGLKP
ncbi:MAG: CesT family type III secretion system chaperone [Chlamydiota bacterium]